MRDREIKPLPDAFLEGFSKVVRDQNLQKTGNLNEELVTENGIKGWKHAGRDIAKHRAKQGKDVKLVSLKKDGTESKMHDATEMFRTKEEAIEKHESMVKLNPNKKIRHNLYVDGKIETLGEGVITEAKKIACLKCDEVSTTKAWEKNNGSCPKCNNSTQGVAESVNEAKDEDKDDDGKGLDPVKSKQLKKDDVEDRKDPDIDNDGDVDDSDEYLHKRRKAISKAMKEMWSTRKGLTEASTPAINATVKMATEDGLRIPSGRLMKFSAKNGKISGTVPNVLLGAFKLMVDEDLQVGGQYEVYEENDIVVVYNLEINWTNKTGGRNGYTSREFFVREIGTSAKPQVFKDQNEFLRWTSKNGIKV